MLFSGIPFLYYFLPVVLAAYFLLPKNWRNTVLLVSSLVFYGWGEPKYLALMVLTIGVFYGCGIAMEKSGRKKLWLWVASGFGIILLVIFKYADFFISSFAAITGLNIDLLRLALPIGISFYTFQCISYVADVYRGRVEAQRSIVDFGAYVVLFPQLIAGPIVRYSDVAAQLKERSTTLEDASLGVRRFLVGLGKKVLIANAFGVLIEAYRTSAEPSVLFVWLYAAAFMLQIYFDFSGYSDMAIGLGRILGFHFPENFDYPYLSRSVTEFWRRWHMTLGGWFRDYVYIPMGGNRVSRGRWVINILTVWSLTGLWHGAAWNFVLWGLLFALVLMAEKWLPGLKNLPVGVSRLYVLAVILFSFVLFNGAGLSGAIADMARMLGLGGIPGVTVQSLYYLRSYGILFAAAVVGATPLPKKLAAKLPQKAAAVLEPIFLGLVLLVCTAYLVDGSFNPFLYFRF